MGRWLTRFLLVGLLVPSIFLPWTTPTSGSRNPGVVLARDNPYVTVYTLPERYDPKYANLAASYSYSHKLDGTLMDGPRAGNVVKTSRGRILATVLTTTDYHGRTIDGIGVYDITEGKNVFGVTIAMGDKTMRSARSGEWRFKAQIRDGSRVSVWADPNLLDRTTRDSYYLLIDDLYTWRAAKARGGADLVTLGSKVYHLIVANSPGASAGWAFFDPDDLDKAGGRARPRYFVTTTIRNNGEFVRPPYPLPIGDSGYFSVYDRATDRFTFREGGDRPLRWPDEVPDLPRERPLPDIPTIPDLPPMRSVSLVELLDLARKGKPDKAIEVFTEALDVNPLYAAAYYHRGLAWYEKKEYDKAISDYDDAILFGHADANVFTYRGLAWYSKQEYDRAIKDFDEAIRLDPHFAFAFNNRGRAWYQKKDQDRAIEDYGKAIVLNPDDAAAFYNRGLAWCYKKEYDRAIKDFDEAIRLDPKDASAFNGRGFAWYYKKELDRALKDYEEAIRLDPRVAEVFNNRGVAWHGKKEYDRAIDDFTRAVELDADFADAYANRATTWAAKGDSERAAQDRARAEQIRKRAGAPAFDIPTIPDLPPALPALPDVKDKEQP